jgi:hypothetical protein
MVEAILSPGLFDIANANRILNSAAVGASNVARREQIIRSGQQKQVEIVNQRTSKPRKSNEELTKIISFLSNVVDRIKTIRRLADKLTAEVSKADRFKSGDNAVHFDVILARLSRVADQTGAVPNLLNSSSGTDFAFLTTEDGRVVTLSGAALGTGYTITETGDNAFGAQLSTTGKNRTVIFSDHQARVIRQVDPLKEPFTAPLPANFVDIFKDVRLDSIDKFDPNKVTITVFAGTTAAKTFTGTVTRDGLGVLDSFLYDGFKTAAGRGRALKDLRAAKATIDAELARFEGALKSAREIFGERDLSLAGFVSLIDSKTAASVIELHAADSARAFQNDFDVKLVNGVETARNQLGKILGGLDFGSRTNTVVDLIA